MELWFRGGVMVVAGRQEQTGINDVRASLFNLRLNELKVLVVSIVLILTERHPACRRHETQPGSC
jgi:hypothetical protein